QDEERRPEVAEWSEVSGGCQRESMPCVLARAVAARGNTGEHRDERRDPGESEREPLRPEEGGELRRSGSRDVRVDPILLEQTRREADVFGRAVGHQKSARA